MLIEPNDICPPKYIPEKKTTMKVLKKCVKCANPPCSFLLCVQIV